MKCLNQIVLSKWMFCVIASDSERTMGVHSKEIACDLVGVQNVNNAIINNLREYCDLLQRDISLLLYILREKSNYYKVLLVKSS